MIELPIAEPMLQLTLLVVGVLLVHLLFQRLRIPALVGLLVVGMLVGPGGFQLVPPEPVVGQERVVPARRSPWLGWYWIRTATASLRICR